MQKANCLTPVVTAFDAVGNLDIQANKNIYDHLINGGVDGIVVMGSTGEFFSMTTHQKKELITLALNYINKRTKVYIGTGCMLVEDTIQLSNFAIDSGATAVMVISPYYFTLSDESVEFFYDQVASQIKGDMFLYNFPARTGHDLSPQVTLNLLRKHKNIVGFKDTVTEMGHTRKLITTVTKEFPNFMVFSGFDENFMHNIVSGGSGCIGGLSNIYPEVFAAWVNAIDCKDMDKISKIQKKVDKMMDLYAIGTPYIPILKTAMILHGVKMQNYCTKPFVNANNVEIEKIKKIMCEAEEM